MIQLCEFDGFRYMDGGVCAAKGFTAVLQKRLLPHTVKTMIPPLNLQRKKMTLPL